MSTNIQSFQDATKTKTNVADVPYRQSDIPSDEICPQVYAQATALLKEVNDAPLSPAEQIFINNINARNLNM